MLKNFLYLDEVALAGYLSQLEDGARQTRQQSRSNEKTKSIGVAKAPVNANARDTRGTQDVTESDDTAPARFERLLALVDGQEESIDWISVVNPETDLSPARIGTMLEMEADIYVPAISRMLSNQGGTASALASYEALMGLMTALGKEIPANAPPPSQVSAIRAFVEDADSPTLFIGDIDGTNTRIMGRLSPSGNPRDIEGPARVIGKVARQWGPSTWKPLMSFAALDALPREKRREMERKGPGEGQEDNWVQGPAIELDVVAIYR